ncbi:TOBE domain-containing protein [Fontimonas sp. SYSU GA230001]|uniref:TOBE domain-containing protein n=1 Tax=Fontimonas sp. SYSU GA230001 TaxID=3142450 RepID=UPI0032B5EA05
MNQPSDASDEALFASVGGPVGGRRRLALLQAIAATGSLVKAAKAAGFSYKGAWDAVEAMNNLAEGTLVTRTTGGRGGGGTWLTPRGRELLAMYEKLLEGQRGLVARIGREHASAARDLPVLGRIAMLSSARNQFVGRVTALRRGTVNDEVELEIAGGQRLFATVTHGSAHTMRLKTGVPLTALIKASWVLLASGAPDARRCSAGNQLGGTVARVQKGAVNSEVVLALDSGLAIAAIVSNTGLKDLGLRKGEPATAMFNAASVILVRLD